MGDSVNMQVASQPGIMDTASRIAWGDTAALLRSHRPAAAMATKEGVGVGLPGAKDDHRTCSWQLRRDSQFNLCSRAISKSS